MDKEKSASPKVQYVDFSKTAKSLKSPQNTKAIVAQIKPSVPVYFLRPNALERCVNWFLDNFSGTKLAGKNHASEVLYSVKSNPDENVLKRIFQTGIRHFDVASLNEIRLINGLFGDQAKMYFMHPIKPREAIHEAYFNYGIRHFSLDSSEELKKILEVTKNAKDLGLHLRMAIPNSHSAIDLSRKFGIRPTESIALVRKMRAVAKTFGMCFHVGSQCMDPVQYRAAMYIVDDVLKKAKVKIDVLDIGGGFPSIYPAMNPPSLKSYVEEIKGALSEMEFLSDDCKIWCEPGRAMVAESGSLLVRIEGRKGNMLYINDGTYGGLFDAGYPAFIYPCKAHRIKRGAPLMQEEEAFGFYGPTCDSLDTMKGPFYLPKNINEGDYIEVGQLGAYSKSIRTDFNGFNEILQFEVQDEPLASLYVEEEADLAEQRDKE